MLDRVERLELQAKRLRQTVVLLLALVAAITVVALAGIPSRAVGQRPQVRTIEAERFVLVDSRDKVRATLDARNGPGLALLDENGRALAGISASPGHSILYLNDSSGTQRAVLSVLAEGFGLGLNDERGRERISVKVTRKGPIMLLKDTNGTPRSDLMVIDGGPRLILRDSQGKVRMGLKVGSEGASLVLRDSKEKARAGLSMDDKLGVRFGLMDDRGKVVFYKP